MARNKEEGSVHCSDPSCFRNAAQLWNRQRSHSNPTSKGKPVDAVWQEAYHKSNKFPYGGEVYGEWGTIISPYFMTRRPAVSHVRCIPLLERSTSCLVRIVSLPRRVFVFLAATKPALYAPLKPGKQEMKQWLSCQPMAGS